MTQEEKTVFHYQLEKSLATRIRLSSPQERKEITLAAYRELYERIPWHISRNKSKEELEAEGRYYAAYLRPLLSRDAKVLELGCGSGSTLKYIAPLIREGIGIDATLTKALAMEHPNVTLREDDVRVFSLEARDFDVIYSLHLIEHLHPDDLQLHLQSVIDHLRPGGVHLIITPHAVTGPHDISRTFDAVATGFHLKEYSYAELFAALKSAGFAAIRSQVLPRSIFSLHPALYQLGMRTATLQILYERIVGLLPSVHARRALGGLLRLNNIVVCARKP